MSWQTVAISEVSNVVTGSTPKTNRDDFFGGDIPFVTPAELEQASPIVSTPRTLSTTGAQQVRLVPPNAILVCCIGSLGKVGIAGCTLATNQQINAIVFDEGKVWPRFGYYACRLLKPTLENMAPATTVAIVSKSKFQALEILLPPLDEQKRIAAILDQADELRRKRKHALDRLNQLGQAIFYEMFGDLLLSEDNSIPLGDVCDVRDGTHDSPKYVDEGFPLLTSKNFSGGRIDYKEANLISEKDFMQINKRSKVDIGDIVMPMIGTIGSPVIIDFDPDFAIKNVALIKFKNSEMTAEFVRQILDGPLFKLHVSNKGRGGTQKFVSLGDIRGFKIPVPSSARQNLFSERMHALRAEKIQQMSSMIRTEGLFNSLQYRAFRGEL